MFKVTGRQNARVLYAKAQLKGGRTRQDDTLDHYLDECFVAADGVSTVPNGDIAARLGAETAVWGYKFIRTKRFYWHDKKLLLKRIFRSANIAVWQKARERAFRSGLATTLTVVIIGDTVIWTGHVGASRGFLYR